MNLVHLLANTLQPTSVQDYIQWGGIIGILAFIIIGGSRKWWVFGWQYKDLQERYEKVEQSNVMWMQVALRGVTITEKIVTSAGVTGDGQIDTPTKV